MGGGGGGFSGFGGAPNLNDLFGDLFGARSGFGGARIFDDAAPGEGQDIIYKVEISLRDAVTGRTIELNLKRPVRCEVCSGSGLDRKGGSGGTCPDCGGTGQRRSTRIRIRMVQPCQTCSGTGKLPGDPCPACGGRGLSEGSERLAVKIPPGVDNGSKVRVAGKGYPGERGGPAGDLFLDITVQHDPFFKREGSDLRTDIDVPFQLAVLGGKVDVDTLDGQVKLTIPRGTQGGQVFRLAGKGVPALGGRGRRGDLFVRMNLIIPKNLTKKARELLDELAGEME
jgi:molecular chaperone DnaJ